MKTTDELLKRIRTALAQEIFVKEPKHLYEPIVYSMQQGGKRIRPLLTLMACDLFGGDVEEAVHPALGVEIFHNFTLLHDDIMDNAPIRRGQPTVFHKWQQNIAILSGDAMFALAYRQLAQTRPDCVQDLIQAFNRVAIGVCEGQQFDMDYEKTAEVSIPDYINMIRLKTSVLLGGALEIGGIIAKASPEDLGELYAFGVKLGLAFQLQDDLLDVYSNVEKFGKVHGGDIACNKKTFLYLKALELSDNEQEQQLRHYFSTTDFTSEEKFQGVVAIFNKLSVKKHTQEQIIVYKNEALHHLSHIAVDEYRKEPLRQFIETLMVREL